MYKAIRRTILKMAEPKHTRGDYGKIELYHNSGSPASGQILPAPITISSIMPAQGVGDNQRTGDQIYTKGIGVKMLLGLKADRHNCTFRIIVWSGPESSRPTSYAEMFEMITNNVLLDSVNTDRGRFLKNSYYKPRNIDVNAVGANKEWTTCYKFWVPWRKLVKFNTDGGITTATNPVHVYVFAYDAYGSFNTDNIAYVQTWASLYYRDP